MNELTKSEELLLLAIMRLKNGAYGVSIKQKLLETSNRAMPYGTLYFILEQLSNKGYVKRSSGLPTPERGGRRKSYYRLTEEGKTALSRAYEMQQNVWRGFPDLVTNYQASK